MAASTLLLALLAVPAFANPFSSRATQNSISWTDCSAKPSLPQNLQCGTLVVPVDWNAPAGGPTLNLSMVRLLRPANSTAKRVGHLILNPGGPGISATMAVGTIATGEVPVSSELLNAFDIIGLDARGIGGSSQIKCDPAIYNERVSLYPKTNKDYNLLVDKNKRLGKSCLKLSGEIVNHVDTIAVAKDLEAVRAALGEKLNMLGLSYGTQVGAQYAQLFPDNIRAMALDGMLQHSQSEAANIVIESTGYESQLKAFFAWASADAASPLKGKDVEKLWSDLLRNATQKPIPAPGCSSGGCLADVNEEEFRFNLQTFLYSAQVRRRTRLANALLEASQGNATLFSRPLALSPDSGLYAGIAIGCQDWASTRPSFEDIQAKIRLAEEVTPLLKGASQTWSYLTSCLGWPAPLNNPLAKLNVKTKDPILMVNSVGDPATGYAWALGMQDEIQNHSLLTRNGSGHQNWRLGGETAAAIDRFLITKKIPVSGTVLDS